MRPSVILCGVLTKRRWKSRCESVMRVAGVLIEQVGNGTGTAADPLDLDGDVWLNIPATEDHKITLYIHVNWPLPTLIIISFTLPPFLTDSLDSLVAGHSVHPQLQLDTIATFVHVQLVREIGRTPSIVADPLRCGSNRQ